MRKMSIDSCFGKKGFGDSYKMSKCIATLQLLGLTWGGCPLLLNC